MYNDNNNNNNNNGSRGVELGNFCSGELHFMSSVRRCLLRIPTEVTLCGYSCTVVTIVHFECGSRDVTQCEPSAVWHCTSRRDRQTDSSKITAGPPSGAVCCCVLRAARQTAETSRMQRTLALPPSAVRPAVTLPYVRHAVYWNVGGDNNVIT